MAKRRRSTLNHFFRSGALPTADQFCDFIDSSVNQVDDGFDKSPENGLEISSVRDYDNLISFFRENRADGTMWRIGFNQEQDTLVFSRRGLGGNTNPVLALSPDGRVGIGNNDPKEALDVDGVVRSSGRLGRDNKGLVVPADGDWHDITETLTGCHALEVMAGIGQPGSGRYSLMHAMAMNTYNPRHFIFSLFKRKNPIKTLHAFYGRRSHRLRLRWNGTGREFRLQLSSRCRYGEGYFVRYHITQLWFDPGMNTCHVVEEEHG